MKTELIHKLVKTLEQLERYLVFTVFYTYEEFASNFLSRDLGIVNDQTMKWNKNEEADVYYCKTPIGQFELVGDSVSYNVYLDGNPISRNKDLETAKEDARTDLFTTYYKLKLFLELHE